MMYEELVKWSESPDRPVWQQDALRRIVENGAIGDNDLSAFVKIIERNVGLIDEKVTYRPLAQSHLSTPTKLSPRTILHSIGPVQGFDRLASDQSPLQFCHNGLTLVYGHNGSGKSGYCRILKKLCRPSDQHDLRGDIYADAPQISQQVSLRFAVDDGQPVDKIWKAHEQPPKEMMRLSVFDSKSVQLYIDKDKKLEFLPYELNILNQLGLTARFLAGVFKKRRDELGVVPGWPFIQNYNVGTRVHSKLSMLSSQIESSNIPSEDELISLAKWDEDKERRVQEINQEKNQNPATQVPAYTAIKQQLENVRNEISTCFSILGSQEIVRLSLAHKDKVNKADAAEVAAKSIVENLPIPQIGSGAWRQMITYAREFAAEVVPGAPDPKISTAGVCVLCQQALQSDAASRMKKFDDYLLGRFSKESDTATQNYNILADRIRGLRISNAEEVRNLLEMYATTGEHRRNLVNWIVNAYLTLNTHVEAAKLAIENETPSSLTGIKLLIQQLIDEIDKDLVCLQSQIDQLNARLSAGNARMQELNSEMLNLMDERQLSYDIAEVLKYRNNVIRYTKLVKAESLCNTTAISRQLSSRRESLITNSLRTRLDEERAAFMVSYIPVSLSDKSEAADSFVEMKLDTNQLVKKRDILSEGEQSALSLACFFSELSEFDTKYGVIFDDPVSSLDNVRMTAVAKRIVKEVKSGRQVVVFTHSLAFHYLIRHEAEDANIKCESRTISSAGGSKFGIIDATNAFSRSAKNVDQRINDIAVLLNSLKDSSYDPSFQKFKPQIVEIYNYMRETWERIIEEVLFSGSITRFQPGIQTTRLVSAFYDPDIDYEEIDRGMTSCSRFTGHDQSVELPENLPYLSQVEDDFANLKVFYERTRARRKEYNKKYENLMKSS